MKNLFATGDTNVIVAAADRVAGELVVFGDIHGIAQNDALTGEDLVINVVGVYTVPKINSEAFTNGEFLYYNTTNKELTTTVGSNVIVGTAFGDAQSAAEETNVRLVQRSAV